MKKINAYKTNNFPHEINQDKYTYNDVIIDHNDKNIYFDLEKKIKLLKDNWKDKEAFYSILHEINYEIMGESYHPEEDKISHSDDYNNTYNINKSIINNNNNPNMSIISSDNHSNLKK